MASGYAGYLVSSWVAGFSQHWLVLLPSAIIAAFAVGWVLPLGMLGVNFCCSSVWSGGGWAGDN